MMRGTQLLTPGLSTALAWLVAQEARIHRRLQLIVLRRAIRAAYPRFAATHRELCDSLFDRHFLETRVAPLLAEARAQGRRLAPATVSAAWFDSVRAPGGRAERHALREVTAAAAELLALLEQQRGAA
jgi:hypothetical protein